MTYSGNFFPQSFHKSDFLLFKNMHHVQTEDGSKLKDFQAAHFEMFARPSYDGSERMASLRKYLRTVALHFKPTNTIFFSDPGISIAVYLQHITLRVMAEPKQQLSLLREYFQGILILSQVRWIQMQLLRR